MPTPPLPIEVQAALAEPVPAVIATVRPDGQPVTVPTWYLVEDDRHLLLSIDAANARGDRLAHLRAHPLVSITALGRVSWYDAVIVQGRAVEFFDDVDLELVDRMSAVHTGAPYGIRRPRTAVRVEITEWSRPVPKT
ncbi:pyridoxamine 5'-phosphate oxidase family protein [Saccharopolyspora sp. NPDC049426]|uniref:pyridoxamine 5'-phosphate oxidase family protein n=1 Tax=Saccharopolyspora sp. NPDC049426 TaxID=3155652 RepID=UPI00341B4560